MLRTLLQFLISGAATMILLLLTPLAGTSAYAQDLASAHASNPVSVFATGLDNPRGLVFGPDGNLYVAEGGLGGTHSTVGQCKQVPSPIGPYTGGLTARISRISTSGARTTVVDKLPSARDHMGDIIGVSDVTFIGNTLYGLLSGGGCSHGVPQIPNGIVQVNSKQSTWKLIANLSQFLMTHPVKHPDPADFEPDGTWYSMVQAHNNLYAVEPNHGELDKIGLNGQVSRIVDISASRGHIVPTAVAYHDGNFYVGNLNTFPIKQGSSVILKITPDGKISTFATGLTTVLGVAFDCKGQLYALENTVGKPFPTPGTGAIVRVTSSGAHQTIASGLMFPTAMTFGPHGNLYVSTFGFGFGPGKGQVERIDTMNGCK